MLKKMTMYLMLVLWSDDGIEVHDNDEEDMLDAGNVLDDVR